MNDRQRVLRPGSDDGDGDDERPRRKKNTVQMHPVVGILVLFVLPLVFVAIFAWAWMSRDRVQTREDARETVVDNNDKFKEIKQQKMKRAHELYRVARKNKMDPDFPPEQLTIDQQTARDYIALVKQELDALLDPLRDDEGMLPREYNGYQRELRQLIEWQSDILKESGF